MEQVYKKGSKFFGMASGLQYDKDDVQDINGCYWHCHPVGMPVTEVMELPDNDGYPDTRVHGGYPMYPAQKGSK